MDREKGRATEEEDIFAKNIGERTEEAPALAADLPDGSRVAAASSDWDDTTAAVDAAAAVNRTEKGGTGPDDSDTKATNALDWDADPDNPYNWTKRKRWAQVGMAASFAIVA